MEPQMARRWKQYGVCSAAKFSFVSQQSQDYSSSHNMHKTTAITLKQAHESL